MIHPGTEIHLYLIRHAESHMNINPHLVGGRSASTPLSQLGEDQSTALYKYFNKHGINFDLVYCSPFVRTKSTAEISLGGKGPVILVDNRLVEYSAGDFEGKIRSEIHTAAILHQMAEMGLDFQPPGGESQRQVILRVSEWLREAILGNQPLLESGLTVRISCYSHGLTIKCLLHHILGFDSHLIWRMEIDNCSVSKLVYNARGWWPKYINRIPY
jgi:broad specificity phosphatase PhoE